LQTKWVFDAEGRFNPSFHDGSESEMPGDMVIVAIGQATRLDFLQPEDGVEVSPRGFVVVNPESLMTSAPGVFAAGDCVLGPRLLIDSIADGKRAAAAIDDYLSECGDSSPLSDAATGCGVIATATGCGGTLTADESAVEKAGASSRTPKSSRRGRGGRVATVSEFLTVGSSNVLGYCAGGSTHGQKITDRGYPPSPAILVKNHNINSRLAGP
jgi:NADH dehydrogenase FAD-containing subunit